MTVNETLAQASNAMVYGSMTAFTGAMAAFSISLAKGRRLEAIEVSAERASASHQVRMGSTATLDKPAVSTSVSDGEELGEGRRAGNIGMSLTWLGTLLLGAGIIFRGLSAGRAPIGNMYEFSLAGGFAVGLTYCLLSLSRDLRWLGLFITIPVLLDLGLAITVLYTESAQLVPALNSYWLAIHVTAAVVCLGAFTMGAALSCLYLVAQAAEDRVAAGMEPGRSAAIAQRIPSADRLDLMAYRIHAFMFPIWTFAVIAGAIWAEAAWGRYWGWDPKETWAFITWVIYAAYLHARATAGWRGKKAAYVAIAGYAAILFNYFIVNIFVQGLHSYSGL
ncbi:MAG: c-type cytochrome biogenesis protein CcsB [Actinobacteria bacterium]|nr:c-type cytochrome biogenesis protein CcsB [Actinomycetota bacterium]NBO34953.1 c-type cytochrome biogenesis protein CcsB [Actinomycetota bacterium]